MIPRGMRTRSITMALILALGLSTLLPMGAQAASEKESKLSKLKFGTPINLGYPIRTVSINDGVMGKENRKGCAVHNSINYSCRI